MSGYIELLPDELLVVILSFLPTSDLLAVARVSNRFCNIVSDRRVVGHVDLQGAYQITTENLRDFLLPRTRCRNITGLAANHVYWIKFPVFITKLKNLASLHILGSPLTATQLLAIFTACPKLEELSINWPDDVKAGSLEEGRDTAKRLRSLAVLLGHIPLSLLHLLQHTEALTSLTVTNHHASNFFASPSSTSGSELNVSLPHLTDLTVDNVGGNFSLNILGELVKRVVAGAGVDAEWRTFWVNTPMMMMKMYNPSDLATIMSKCQRLYLLLTLNVYEQLREARQLPRLHQLLINGQTPRSLSLTTVLHNFTHLRSLHLHGLNISLDLKHLQEVLPDIEQLSVCCRPQLGPTQTSAIASLTRLTHLSVPVCALIETLEKKVADPKEDGHMPAPTFGSTKRRVGYTPGQAAHNAAFNLVLENCPLLRVLEIGFSISAVSCNPGRIWWECLENIKKLSNLTHLTLDGIPVRSGTFFIQIAQGCHQLEFLRLQHLGPSGSCTYLNHLSQALPYCHNLCHFRIEQNYLAPATSLWAGLRRCERLERLFVLSESDGRELDLKGLDTLISDLPSIVFVFVAGSHTLKSKCAALTRKYRTSSRPALVVRVRTGLWDVFDDSNAETRLIPAIHFNEMITFRSWVFESYAQPCRKEKERGLEARKRMREETETLNESIKEIQTENGKRRRSLSPQPTPVK